MGHVIGGCTFLTADFKSGAFGFDRCSHTFGMAWISTSTQSVNLNEHLTASILNCKKMF